MRLLQRVMTGTLMFDAGIAATHIDDRNVLLFQFMGGTVVQAADKQAICYQTKDELLVMP